MRKNRTKRGFNPSLGLESRVRGLEPRFLAASSLLHDRDFIPAILLYSSNLPQSPSYSGVANVSPIATAPGFAIVAEPGIFSSSVDPQAPVSPFLDSDTALGTEQASSSIGGSAIPPPFTGAMTSQVGNSGDLYADADKPSIGVDCAIKADVGQTSLITGGPMPWALNLDGQDGTGATPGTPAPVTWAIVDTDAPGDPLWSSVSGNPPDYLTGNFIVSLTTFQGQGGFNPPAGDAPNPVFPYGGNPPGPHPVPVAPPVGGLDGTGIFFNSAATGIVISGPVMDPQSGDPNSLLYAYPSLGPDGGFVFNVKYEDNFFAGDHTDSIFAQFAAPGPPGDAETITYQARLSTAIFTAQTDPQPLADGTANMSFSFTENVSASPP